MEMPGDNKGLSGLHITPPVDENAADIVKAVLVMIRVWGRVTGRGPEAEGIAISVLNGMQKE